MLNRDEKRYIYRKLDIFLERSGANKTPPDQGKIIASRTYQKIVHDLKDFIIMKSDRVGNIVSGMVYLNRLFDDIDSFDPQKIVTPAPGRWDIALRSLDQPPSSFYSKHDGSRTPPRISNWTDRRMMS